MDTGKGKFVQVEADNEEELAQKQKAMEEAYPEHGGWYRAGDLVTVAGSRFRIKSVKPGELVLKLVEKIGRGFHVGEVIELNESRFRVKAAKHKTLRLKLLPRSKKT